MRSYLYIPATRPDLVAKIETLACDAVILDLEDAVPADRKEEGRRRVADHLRYRATGNGPRIFVRINAGVEGGADLKALNFGSLDGIFVPKCESAADIHRADKAIERLAAESGVAVECSIIALIESGKGILELGPIAAASRRLAKFAFGAADFVFDVGARPTPDRTETFLARSMLVTASAALGLGRPIAHAFIPHGDLAGLERACEEDRNLGFGARTAIHPKQIPTINRLFAPTQAEIARAEIVVARFEEANARGLGAFVLEDGTFVDAAIMKWATATLAANR